MMCLSLSKYLKYLGVSVMSENTLYENELVTDIKCNHDVTDPTTTLTCLPKRRLIRPNILDFYCPICHGCFKYIKDSENVLSLVK